MIVFICNSEEGYCYINGPTLKPIGHIH